MPSQKKSKEGRKRGEALAIYTRILQRPFFIIKSDPLALTGGIILVLLTLVAIFAPAIATHDPHEMLEKSEGIIFRYQGEEWEFFKRLSPLALNDATTVHGHTFAVGHGGMVASYDGREWSIVEIPTKEDLYGVSFPSLSYGMVVGARGECWLYEENQWREIPTPIEEDLLAVELLAFNYGLAVGEKGSVLQWNGNSFEKLPSPTSETLESVSLLSKDLGFIVGSQGVILRYSKEGLSQEMVMSFRDLKGVKIYQEDLALAVGARGTIFRFDGSMWRSEFGPETRELRGIHFLSEDHIMVIGRFGVIIEYSQGSWRVMDNPYRRHWRAITGSTEEVLVLGTDPYINELSPPTWENLFGTTHLGRDIFSQTVYGTRTALIIGFVTAFFVNIIGVNVGLFAGYFRGRVDDILMRIVDIMYALPFEPFAMLLVMIFDPSITVVILSIGLLIWRTIARVIRSQVLSLAQRPFVKATRGAGASDSRILYLHIAPNILPLAFLQLAVAMGYAITAEATLSFLGLGPPRVYSWGTILHAARLSGAWRTAWWWIIPPGLLIMITVVCIFLIARALEILTNPRLEGELDDARS